MDAYAREYTTTLAALLDRHAPLKTRRRVTRPVVPWYNKTIDNAKGERKEAERKWRKIKAADDLLDFKSKRNHVTYLMNKARRDFYSEFMVENGADQRKLFNAAKKLLGMKDKPLFAEHLDKTIIANDIGILLERWRTFAMKLMLHLSVSLIAISYLLTNLWWTRM